ncbi:MAG: hypothetical protein IPJ97_14815 [Proteobacteria bacterium]|nr:hypothetical protein [Pseudomonadota bacterium]
METSTWLAPMRGIALLATLLVVAPAAATNPAAPAVGGEWNFRVLLDGKEVGWHRYIVRGDGAATEVESRAQFDVRFLLLNAYTYRHTARERWHGACLDELESRTETNGRVEEVAAVAYDDAMVVDGPSGDARLSGCVMSFAYWDPRILRATRLLNSQTGELLPVSVAEQGTERVNVAGRNVVANRHRLSAPDLQIDLWYADGRWVALEAPTPGGRTLRYEL